MTSFRRLTESTVFSGRGLHTGADCSVRLSPGGDRTGVWLHVEEELVPLACCSLSGTGRGTEVFLPGGASLKTTEHLFAALSGLGIHSVVIEASGPEIPALDGCAATFARELEARSRPVDDGQETLDLTAPVCVEDPSRGALVAAFPCPELHISYVIRYEEEPIGTQLADYVSSRGEFLASFAPARTFALFSELESLRARGLAQGGTLENALLVEGQEVQASGGLRFPDEFVRHKVLDLLGDLYLLGMPLRARIVAIRSGHDLHCRLVERLKRGAGIPCERKMINV